MLVAARFASPAALFALLFTAAVFAHAAGPYAMTPEGDDTRLVLRGNDPVSYFTGTKPARGDPAFKTEFDGVTYRFVSEENRFTFMKNPFKYVPLFGAHDANSMVYAIPWPGDPDVWKIVDGKLLLFRNEAARRYFTMQEQDNLRSAERFWKDEVAGSIAVVQRNRRLVMRVPHYKTDQALEAEWQSRGTRQ